MQHKLKRKMPELGIQLEPIIGSAESALIASLT